MNSYQDIKDFILSKLQKDDGVLKNKKIYEEINNTKNLISKIGLETFAQVLSVPEVCILSDNEWDRMISELKEYFSVEIKQGTLIQGDKQRSRNTTWWTNSDKLKSDKYYWKRYSKYIGKSLPPDVVRTIDSDTDNIMNNIGNPNYPKFSRYGMVVGHVQSGKTSNYISLICKAVDAGYKFIVVIAGGINNLRNQTQQRLNEGFIGKDDKHILGVGKLGNTKRDRRPISLTTKYLDFNKQDAEKNADGGLNFDNVNVPILLVIKKHTRTLDNVTDWITNQYNKQKISNHAMLMIDDESDYASINIGDEDNPTTINYKIRKLINLFNKSVYVAYTATPYANIFIDHNAKRNDIGKDLFPSDFIYSLAAPSNYFGARKMFLDSDKKYLREINDYSNSIPLKHKKNFDVQSIPFSLYQAINVFIINVAIRNLRHQGNKHNSMLIHITRFTRVHQQIAFFVEKYIDKVRKDINSYGMLKNAESYSKFIKNINENYNYEYNDLEFTWIEVLDSICNIIDSIIVREVHQGSSVPLEYRDGEVTNVVVIGGTSLSRGFTLEGLSVSYFLRNTIFYDTLMQMGRWFGYRTGYEDLCRVYMTYDMMDNFACVINATEELFDTFKRMRDEKKTPNDFGLAVRQHPDSILQVTARNKQKNAEDYYFEMNLDGVAKETSWLSSDLNTRKNNLKAINNIIKRLQDYKNIPSKINNSYLWIDVDKKNVIDFLEEFKVYTYNTDSYGLKFRMPIKFIKEYVRNQDTKWDIALYSGEGNNYSIDNISINKEKRRVNCRDGFYEVINRQVSSGNAEAIVFPDNERKKLGSKRSNIRQKMIKPLLMLHILQVKDEKTKSELEDGNLAAFGISFPGTGKSRSRTILLKINSVYVEKLISEELSQEESDD